MIALSTLGWGCGPSVDVAEEGTADGTTGAAPTTDAGHTIGMAEATSDTPPGESTAAGPFTGGSDDAGLDESTVTGATTGEMWLFPPGSSYSWLSCDRRTGATTLLMELYVEPPPTDCVPEPSVDASGLVFLGVVDWDGNAGTFVAGPDGPLQGTAGDLEMIGGSIELTVSEPFVPDTAILDLQTEDGQAIVGLAEIGTCFRPPEMPCG